ALLYAVLASSFRAEPSAEVLSELTDRTSSLKGRMTRRPLSVLQPCIDSLLKALVSATPEALAGDYADLFLAGKNGRLAPSESAYLEKTIYGQATVDVIET